MLRALILSCLVATAAAGAAAQEYLIQPGDRLEITVIEDPSLNRSVLVRPDGRISLPLAGSLQAAGGTPEALEALIRRRLSRDFVEPPSVTVALVGLADTAADEQADLASIYVLGEVPSPGLYRVALPMDVLQALALAGGPGTFAARKRVQVRRRQPGGPETVLLLDYDLVERGGVPSAEISLADGDLIIVPERRLFE